MKKIIMILLFTHSFMQANLGDGLNQLFQSMNACFHPQTKEQQPINRPHHDHDSDEEQEESPYHRCFLFVLWWMSRSVVR